MGSPPGSVGDHLTRRTRSQVIDHLPNTIQLASLDSLHRLEPFKCAVGLFEPRPDGIIFDHFGEGVDDAA